ncbi:iron chelate uptake ABC transporter family permease subunit [Acidovorax sp. NCPPB 2350]|nr:iron chelate uptake ABC transporter family permease subunit [Acidovorax sp. NCPPB 2350]
MNGRTPALTPARRLGLLLALAVLCIGIFMTWGVEGDWAFALRHRGTKLVALLLVAYAVAVSTVLFQTLTHNRILTPSVMGFDALYVLIQTALVFGLGLERLGTVDLRLKFVAEVLLMSGLACLLFRWLFSGALRSLHLTLLVGIVFGILFRSLTSFMVRLIDPNEFLVLQDRLFASFNLVAVDLLSVAALAVAGVSAVLWRMRHLFDALALGRDMAINLGIDHARVTLRLLVLIAALVSVSTALVGPVTFLGLLVANLAYHLMRSDRHQRVLPAAVLLGVVFLVGGQVVLEQLFGFNTALSVVIEFFGGLMFIALLMRRVAR